MSRYVVGDIQGCYTPLMKLLSEISFNPSKDILYLVGDLVNRGKDSLEVLRWVYDNQDSIISVLGNHDIYLLLRHGRIKEADYDDSLHDLLLAPDIDKMIDWVRECPLVYQDSHYIIAHAGIYPRMDFNQLMLLNHLFSDHLKAKDYLDFIRKIYGDKPNYWNTELSLHNQIKFAVNSCTRMRYLYASDYSLDYKHKGKPAQSLTDIVPWFKVDFHATVTKKIIFGHWASLGLYQDAKCICIDTGGVWGKELTALNLENMEFIQFKC